jgi:TonB family protein
MLIALLTAGVLAAAPESVEAPAKRNKAVAPPDYPAACMPAPGVEARPERVTLAYAVAPDGRAVDVRVRESTNECFNSPAVDSARLWRFEPRRVDGKAVRQDDVETTITFMLSEGAALEDVDARPLLRVPPVYPEKCLNIADNFEKVVVEFDVTAEGTTENPRVVESTKKCFHASALKSVEDWRFRPMIRDGAATPRPGVQTQITYELTSSGKDLMRPIVAQRIDKARKRLLRKNPDHAAILAEFDAIEAEFGAAFRPLEMAAFYPLRGAARIEMKDYRGALDDLRIARQRVVEEKSGEAIQRTIEQLEAYVAAEDAALAAKSGAPVEKAEPAVKRE